MTPISLDDLSKSVIDAHARIRNLVSLTPVENIGELGSKYRTRVMAKMENLQTTGSFKLRGATNRILLLSPGEKKCGVVTASNGNHGLGVATAARSAAIAAEVFVSELVAPERVQRIEQLGACIRRIGREPLEAEIHARAAAGKTGRIYIPPYNDPHVVAGQGTVAVELLEQVPGLDAVFVTVGGGGLISGIGAYLKHASPSTQIVGCWPENSRVLYESIRAKAVIDFPEQPTLSDSTSGGVENDSITLALACNVIDRTVLVTEDEILACLQWAYNVKGWLIEGAAAVAMAAYLKTQAEYAGKTVAIVICGGNLSRRIRDLI